jgi:hypothetical protein
MTEVITFNTANAVNETINVANATSENDNVVIATSENLNVANSESEATSKKPAKKKATKKMKLNESISKRVLKDGKYKTDKFKIEEIENTIAILNEYKIALMDSNKNKNINKLIDYAKKLKVSKQEFEKAAEQYLAMEIAA